MSAAESAVEVFTAGIVLLVGLFIIGQISAAATVDPFGGLIPTLSPGLVTTGVQVIVVLMLLFVFVGAVYDAVN